MSIHGNGQVILLPAQLSRLAELFRENGAVKIFQDGSVVTASDGKTSVVINAQGEDVS